MKRETEIKLPPEEATEEQIIEFLRSHDPEELLRQGILEIGEDHTDLEEALLARLSGPDDAQLSVRLPHRVKRLLEGLARRKGLDTSTLVRNWVLESLRREIKVG